MLLGFDDLVARYGIASTGVLHVGAHEGEEAEIYERTGMQGVTWIEANPTVVPRLRANVEPRGHRVIEALVGDTPAVRTFHIANNEQSSSLLEFGVHRQEHPDVVVTESIELRTRTLDEICATDKVDEFGVLVLDLQGAELLALQGATETLAHVDYVYLEVNDKPLYVGCAMVSDLDAYLGDFVRVETVMTQHGWGDALYVRATVLARNLARARIALATARAAEEQARAELVSVQAEREALVRSRSWRITRPLRTLAGVARRLRRRGASLTA
jgi:FkbM family methyltransferase